MGVSKSEICRVGQDTETEGRADVAVQVERQPGARTPSLGYLGLVLT